MLRVRTEALSGTVFEILAGLANRDQLDQSPRYSLAEPERQPPVGQQVSIAVGDPDGDANGNGFGDPDANGIPDPDPDGIAVSDAEPIA